MPPYSRSNFQIRPWEKSGRYFSNNERVIDPDLAGLSGLSKSVSLRRFCPIADQGDLEGTDNVLISASDSEFIQDSGLQFGITLEIKIEALIARNGSRLDPQTQETNRNCRAFSYSCILLHQRNMKRLPQMEMMQEAFELRPGKTIGNEEIHA